MGKLKAFHPLVALIDIAGAIAFLDMGKLKEMAVIIQLESHMLGAIAFLDMGELKSFH
jgi:hypothetical protein